MVTGFYLIDNLAGGQWSSPRLQTASALPYINQYLRALSINLLKYLPTHLVRRRAHRVFKQNFIRKCYIAYFQLEGTVKQRCNSRKQKQGAMMLNECKT